MMRFLVFLSLSVFLLNSTTAWGQKADAKANHEKVYPKVFQIGEMPNLFEELGSAYQNSLLDVCGDDVNKAHARWMDLIRSMEKFSEKEKFDLKGVKVWFKVFWNEVGSIEHIAFHLKPTSKNIDQKKMADFLSKFLENYKPISESGQRYSQYSSASFPTLPQLVYE